MSLELLFENASASAGTNGTPYEKAVFPDVSLMPDVNTGLTDDASTNPTSAKVGNPDAPIFQAKTLLIKDLVLVQDRTQWVNGQPTYDVVFNENLQAVRAFVYGGVKIQKCSSLAPYIGLDSPLTKQRYLQFLNVGAAIGVTGRIRRLEWILQGDTASSATAMRATDGVDTTNIDFSNLASDSDGNNTAKFAAYQHESSNETNDLHTLTLKAEQANTLKVVGVVVYFENSGANLEVLPGRTFVDKALVETTQGATFTVPTFGSSLGGVVAFQKAAQGYTIPIQDANPIKMQGIGNSGTNLVDVTTGQGGSFLVGMGFVAPQGSSQYVGAVRQVSTDTLTVFPTLPFGVSAMVYSSWLSGATYPISQTLMELTTSIGLSNMIGLTSPILDPNGRFAVWGSNVGYTLNLNPLPGFIFKGASGFLQIEGHFQAADIELFGAGERFHATIGINGLPMWGENAALTGSGRRTLFTDGGNGWNSIVIAPGASMGNIEISRINLYRRVGPVGASFGVLALMRVNQAEVIRGAQNATLIGLGMQRRVFADQLHLTGAWTRAQNAGAAGGWGFNGTSTNAALDFQYYGKDLAILGATFTAGSTLIIDGVGAALNANQVITQATLGFHTVRLTAGVSSQIHAVDFFRPYDEIQNEQLVYGAPAASPNPRSQWKTWAYDTAGTYDWVAPFNGSTQSILRVLACGGGGAGGQGTTAAQAGGGGGGSNAVQAEIVVIPGETYELVVGAGGVAVVSSDGGDGGRSIIRRKSDSAELFSVAGGGGGKAAGTGGTGANGGGAGGAGGNAGAGVAGSDAAPRYYGGGRGGGGGSTSGGNGGGGGGGGGMGTTVGGSTTAASESGTASVRDGSNGGGGAAAGVLVSLTPGDGSRGGGGGGARNVASQGGAGGPGYIEISVMLGEYQQ